VNRERGRTCAREPGKAGVPRAAGCIVLVLTLCTLAGVLGSAVTASPARVPPKAAPSSHCVCGRFTQRLATTTVHVYNASTYRDARVGALVQLADRGMQTQDPLHEDVPGEMQPSDLVVATERGLYWIDATSRGGLMAGAWPLRVDASGNVNFASVVGPDNWSPNMFLPGSDGTDAAADEGDAGLGVRVVPSCGSDASTTLGVGTFDPLGRVALPRAHRQRFHVLFGFSGYLQQEFTGGNVAAKDCAGDHARLRYAITYGFPLPDDRRGRPGRIDDRDVDTVMVTLTPQDVTGPTRKGGLHQIGIDVFGIGDDLQHIPTSQAGAYLWMLSSGRPLQLLNPSGCADRGQVWRPLTFAQLCTTPGAQNGNAAFAQDWLQTTGRMRAGQRTLFCTPGCARSLTYVHPGGPFLLPKRDVSVYNASPGVEALAVESQYWNGETVVTNGRSAHTGDPSEYWSEGKPVRTEVDQLVQRAWGPSRTP